MLQLTKEVIQWIKDYYKDNPDGKAIIGISGGKDSTICAALLVQALGKERVIGVLMPNGKQADIDDSYDVCKFLGITNYTIGIGSTYVELLDNIFDAIPSAYPGNDAISTNLPSRLRMATLYAVAALYPNSRVVNTSNYSERYVGYSTKFGDGAGDFSPLGNLLVTEVLAIGDDLGLPHDLVHKTPSDGMSGKTDEDNLGFTYEQLDRYLCAPIFHDNTSEEVMEKIETRHAANHHKMAEMPRYSPSDDATKEVGTYPWDSSKDSSDTSEQ